VDRSLPLVYRPARSRTWTECFCRALAEIALEHVDDPEAERLVSNRKPNDGPAVASLVDVYE
jgi:hypothetical protein